MEQVIANLSDSVRYLQDTQAFERLGVNPPNGLLLFGPPGTGKTMLAEAVAGHAGVPLIMISGSQLIGEHVGEGEKLLRELFQKAKETQPCVLCIDEIDSLAETRFSEVSNGAQLAHNTVTNQLLSLITQKSPKIVLIGTTNKNPDSLDSTLVRAGRFDRHIYVPLPDKKQRKRILQVHTQNKQLHASVSLEELALLSPNYSGAKLATWVNETALLAMQKDTIEITMDDFDNARTTMEVGLSSLENESSLQLKKSFAIHEAGHALIAHTLGEHVYKISIASSFEVGGYVEILPNEDESSTKEALLNRICYRLAGRAAEKIFNIERVGSNSDIKQAYTTAEKMVKEEGMGETISGLAPQENIEMILQQQMKRAIHLLEKNREIIVRIADALLIHQRLRRTDFLNVLEDKPCTPIKLAHSMHRLMAIPRSAYYVPSASDVAHVMKTKEEYIKSVQKGEGGIYIIKYTPNLRAEVLKEFLRLLTKAEIQFTNNDKNGFEELSIAAHHVIKFAALIKNQLSLSYKDTPQATIK